MRPDALGASQADFFTVRWLSIQQRFWGRSQWVLAIDSDVIAVNLTRPLDSLLDLPQDLVLTVRVRALRDVSLSGPPVTCDMIGTVLCLRCAA